MLDCWLQRKKKHYFTYFYIVLYDFMNCLAFADMKQTFHYKVAIE